MLLVSCGTKPAPETAETKGEPAAAAVELSPEARRNAQIEVVEAREETRDLTLEAPGQTTWNDERTWNVGVVATGKVRQVMVQVGDRVKEGQVLARFHAHDVHETQANLLEALADRRRAQANLEQLKRTRDRLKRLYEAKSAPLMQLEQAASDVAMAEQEVQKAQANVDRETHHLTDVLEIPVDVDHKHEGPHEEEGQELELVPIRAPHAATVVKREVTVGSVVTLGQPAFVLADPESLWLIANFPESALPRLKVGLPVSVEVRAYPGRLFPGRIRRLGESLDAATRTLKVVVELQARGALKPEMYATVKLESPAARALVVPAAAVQVMDGKNVVFVEEQPGKFTARPVDVTMSAGMAVVSSGLQAGERVATQGSYLIKSQQLQRAE